MTPANIYVHLATEPGGQPVRHLLPRGAKFRKLREWPAIHNYLGDHSMLMLAALLVTAQECDAVSFRLSNPLFRANLSSSGSSPAQNMIEQAGPCVNLFDPRYLRITLDANRIRNEMLIHVNHVGRTGRLTFSITYEELPA